MPEILTVSMFCDRRKCTWVGVTQGLHGYAALRGVSISYYGSLYVYVLIASTTGPAVGPIS